MKNTVSKGFVYYLFLLFSIVCGVACIFGAILLFSPGTSLFGIKYVNQNLESQYIYEDIYDDSSAKLHDLIAEGKITTINFVTDYVDLNIENKDVVNMRVVVEAKVSGIANTENREKFIVEAEFNEAEKSYTFKCFGPQCNVLQFSNNAKVTFALPKPKDIASPTQNLQINYITETGNITLGKKIGDDYTIKGLRVESTKKSLVEIGNKIKITDSLDLYVNKGEIVLNTTIADKIGNQWSSIEVDKFKIVTDDAKIDIENIKANKFQLVSEASSIKIGKIDGDFEYDAYRGVIIVNTITGIFECSKRVEISNIQVEECYGEVLLPQANTSNLTIGELFANCSISTSSGNVSIKKCHGRTEITTKSGNIEITQLSDNVPAGTLALDLLSETGDIIANLEDVKGNNIINSSDSSSIIVNFTKTANFKLSYTCTEKAPTLSTGIEPGTPQKTGTYYRGDANTSNVLTISNNKGTTKIDDTLVVSK